MLPPPLVSLPLLSRLYFEGFGTPVSSHPKDTNKTNKLPTATHRANPLPVPSIPVSRTALDNNGSSRTIHLIFLLSSLSDPLSTRACTALHLIYNLLFK